ncbi:hypothetical protein V2J09_006074 [Rumex salicifolius]
MEKSAMAIADTQRHPMEFLSRSWSVSRARAPSAVLESDPASFALRHANVLDDVVREDPPRTSSAVSGNPFSFASSQTSQLILERIMSHSQEVSPMTSGRLSYSSGPLTDSPPISPSETDDFKYCRLNNQPNSQYYRSATAAATAPVNGKTVGRWLKDRREKKKEETRAYNAHLHAAVSVAGVASAVAAIAAATAASSSKGSETGRTDMAVASAATLVAAQCVEAAELMGVDRDHLSSVISSAVNVRSPSDIITVTAAAATALRGAAALKARAFKEAFNITTMLPIEKAIGGNARSVSSGSSCSNSGELVIEDNFLGVCSRELLARGCELLKRTRTGELHWKVVSVYINRMNEVTLKMKSRHVAGTITKKKKNLVLEVVKGMPAWPGRHLLEGGEHRRYFGLKTVIRGLVEFECRNQREYDIFTEGVARLLKFAAERNYKYRM